MRTALAAALCLTACTTVSAPQAPPPQLALAPHVFTARDGRTVEAEIGRFAVPENRTHPGGRRVELAFVRFASTSPHPGNPIVYLAGGPGGSGTGAAQGDRFDIFMALREQADVIAFDQRGTGTSNSLPDCEAAAPLAPVLTRQALVAYIRAETARCLAWWRDQGVDVGAYNTRESAADIEALRLAIGADKIDLWAISYGTHLGAAYLRAHHDHVGRAVFAGWEGPDDTVKFPAQTDAMLARLSDVIAADPAASQAYPDFLATMRRVLSRLDAEPVTVTISPRGEPLTVTMDAYPVQLLTAFMIADPRSAARLPAFYLAMDHGQYEEAATVIYTQLSEALAKTGAMPTAMDMASGISLSRLARVEDEARTAVLDDALNFPMPQVLGIAPELDLGSSFRAALAVDTPILFISGTLDGRTYPEAARDALATLPNSRQLVVQYGGHNIYEADPRMIAIVGGWFRDGDAPEQLSFAPPRIPAAR